MHLDSKIFTSLKLLVLSPGKLSSEFIQGKRVTNVPPIRLYVFISFVFFLVFNFVNHFNQGPETEHGHHPLPSFIKMDSTSMAHLSNKSETELDSVINADSTSRSKFDHILLHQLARIINEGMEAYTHTLIKYVSYAMFFLMPLFGFYVYLLNRKSFYIDNLVFSIHIHCFLFLMMTVYFLTTLIYSSDLLLFIFNISGIFYLHRSLHTAFPALKKSVSRTFVLAVIYFFTVAIVLLSVIVLSLIFF
ncbi:MAG: DUF3667 domain-containing protein [Ignavibacteria bacterium]|nr:DUF3667 domain-containing protein [Ignavibacteria bacterium]